MTTSLTSVGAATSSISSMDETNPSASKPITDGDFSQKIQEIVMECREAFSTRNPASMRVAYDKLHQECTDYESLPDSNEDSVRYLLRERDMPGEIIRAEVINLLNYNQIDEAIDKLNLIPFLSQQMTVGKEISFRVKRLILNLVKQGKFQGAVELSEKLNTRVFIDIPELRRNLSHLQKELIKKLVEKNEINLAHRTIQRITDPHEKGSAYYNLVKYYCNINDLDRAESCAQKIQSGVLSKGSAFFEIIKKCCELKNYSRAEEIKNKMPQYSKKQAETFIQESLEKDILAEVKSLVNREEFQKVIVFIQELDELHSLGTRVKLQLELVRILVKKDQISFAYTAIQSMADSDEKGYAYCDLVKYYCSIDDLDKAESRAHEIQNGILSKGRAFHVIIKKCCALKNYSRAQKNINEIRDQVQKKFAETLIQESLEREALAEVESLVSQENFQQAIVFIQELNELCSLETQAKLQLELVRILVKKDQISFAYRVIENMSESTLEGTPSEQKVVNYKASAYNELIKCYFRKGKMDVAEILANKIPEESTLKNFVFYQIIEEYCKREDIANAKKILEKIPRTDQNWEQYVGYIKNAEARLAKN